MTLCGNEASQIIEHFNLPETQFLNKSRSKHHSTTWKIEIKQENTWLPWLKTKKHFLQVMSHTNQKPEEIRNGLKLAEPIRIVS